MLPSKTPLSKNTFDLFSNVLNDAEENRLSHSHFKLPILPKHFENILTTPFDFSKEEDKAKFLQMIASYQKIEQAHILETESEHEQCLEQNIFEFGDLKSNFAEFSEEYFADASLFLKKKDTDLLILTKAEKFQTQDAKTTINHFIKEKEKYPSVMFLVSRMIENLKRHFLLNKCRSTKNLLGIFSTHNYLYPFIAFKPLNMLQSRFLILNTYFSMLEGLAFAKPFVKKEDDEIDNLLNYKLYQESTPPYFSAKNYFDENGFRLELLTLFSKSKEINQDELRIILSEKLFKCSSHNTLIYNSNKLLIQAGLEHALLYLERKNLFELFLEYLLIQDIFSSAYINDGNLSYTLEKVEKSPFLFSTLLYSLLDRERYFGAIENHIHFSPPSSFIDRNLSVFFNEIDKVTAFEKGTYLSEYEFKYIYEYNTVTHIVDNILFTFYNLSSFKIQEKFKDQLIDKNKAFAHISDEEIIRFLSQTFNVSMKEELNVILFDLASLNIEQETLYQTNTHKLIHTLTDLAKGDVKSYFENYFHALLSASKQFPTNRKKEIEEFALQSLAEISGLNKELLKDNFYTFNHSVKQSFLQSYLFDLTLKIQLFFYKGQFELNISERKQLPKLFKEEKNLFSYSMKEKANLKTFLSRLNTGYNRVILQGLNEKLTYLLTSNQYGSTYPLLFTLYSLFNKANTEAASIEPLLLLKEKAKTSQYLDFFNTAFTQGYLSQLSSEQLENLGLEEKKSLEKYAFPNLFNLYTTLLNNSQKQVFENQSLIFSTLFNQPSAISNLALALVLSHLDKEEQLRFLANGELNPIRHHKKDIEANVNFCLEMIDEKIVTKIVSLISNPIPYVQFQGLFSLYLATLFVGLKKTANAEVNIFNRCHNAILLYENSLSDLEKETLRHEISTLNHFSTFDINAHLSNFLLKRESGHCFEKTIAVDKSIPWQHKIVHFLNQSADRESEHSAWLIELLAQSQVEKATSVSLKQYKLVELPLFFNSNQHLLEQKNKFFLFIELILKVRLQHSFLEILTNTSFGKAILPMSKDGRFLRQALFLPSDFIYNDDPFAKQYLKALNNQYLATQNPLFKQEKELIAVEKLLSPPLLSLLLNTLPVNPNDGQDTLEKTLEKWTRFGNQKEFGIGNIDESELVKQKLVSKKHAKSTLIAFENYHLVQKIRAKAKNKVQVFSTNPYLIFRFTLAGKLNILYSTLSKSVIKKALLAMLSYPLENNWNKENHGEFRTTVQKTILSFLDWVQNSNDLTKKQDRYDFDNQRLKNIVTALREKQMDDNLFNKFIAILTYRYTFAQNKVEQHFHLQNLLTALTFLRYYAFNMLNIESIKKVGGQSSLNFISNFKQKKKARLKQKSLDFISLNFKQNRVDFENLMQANSILSSFGIEANTVNQFDDVAHYSAFDGFNLNHALVKPFQRFEIETLLSDKEITKSLSRYSFKYVNSIHLLFGKTIEFLPISSFNAKGKQNLLCPLQLTLALLLKEPFTLTLNKTDCSLTKSVFKSIFLNKTEYLTKNKYNLLSFIYTNLSLHFTPFEFQLNKDHWQNFIGFLRGVSEDTNSFKEINESFRKFISISSANCFENFADFLSLFTEKEIHFKGIDYFKRFYTLLFLSGKAKVPTKDCLYYLYLLAKDIQLDLQHYSFYDHEWVSKIKESTLLEIHNTSFVLIWHRSKNPLRSLNFTISNEEILKLFGI